MTSSYTILLLIDEAGVRGSVENAQRRTIQVPHSEVRHSEGSSTPAVYDVCSGIAVRAVLTRRRI